jgi:hypothetical protein
MAETDNTETIQTQFCTTRSDLNILFDYIIKWFTYKSNTRIKTSLSEYDAAWLPQVGDECIICFEPFVTTNYTITGCGHVYHTECITKSKGYCSKCPMCRRELIASENAVAHSNFNYEFLEDFIIL